MNDFRGHILGETLGITDLSYDAVLKMVLDGDMITATSWPRTLRKDSDYVINIDTGREMSVKTEIVDKLWDNGYLEMDSGNFETGQRHYGYFGSKMHALDVGLF